MSVEWFFISLSDGLFLAAGAGKSAEKTAEAEMPTALTFASMGPKIESEEVVKIEIEDSPVFCPTEDSPIFCPHGSYCPLGGKTEFRSNTDLFDHMQLVHTEGNILMDNYLAGILGLNKGIDWRSFKKKVYFAKERIFSRWEFHEVLFWVVEILKMDLLGSFFQLKNIAGNLIFNYITE